VRVSQSRTAADGALATGMARAWLVGHGVCTACACLGHVSGMSCARGVCRAGNYDISQGQRRSPYGVRQELERDAAVSKETAVLEA
jgi:hypothetical protein